MTKTLYAVTTMGVITNISYPHEGEVAPGVVAVSTISTSQRTY